MNPSVWNGVNPSSRKRPLDTIQEAAPSRNDTLGSSTSAFTSASRSTSQAPGSLGKSLRERFAESKWAKGSSVQLNDISQLSLRYKDGAASKVPASRVEYRSMDSVFAQPPPMSMFETSTPYLNRAPPNHWFSKLRGDWLQPKKEEPKKKKKNNVSSTDTTESQPTPPQSPEFQSLTQTISSQPTSAIDTPSALSPTATQYSQDDTQDLIVWEIDTDDGATLPPSSPMDIDAMGKMVAAFETHTVEDNVPQEMQITTLDGSLQDTEREAMIPIIITDVDVEAPSAVETFASSALPAFVASSPLDNVAPVVNGAMIEMVPSLPEPENTPYLTAEIHQSFEPAPNIPESSTNSNPTTVILNQTPLTQDEHIAAPLHLDVLNANHLPSRNPPHIYPPIATSGSISLSASASTQAVASTSTKAIPDKSTISRARPAQQKNTKPKVLQEGQRNLKNKGVHRCPVPGCTETSTREYDLRMRHMRKAHPKEYDLYNPAKARVRPEEASKLDVNRNVMSVDAEEERKSEHDFRCPSCSHPYSRRDALIRHAESIINPDRKNKPSCNLTVEEVRSLRKKYKAK